MAFALLLVLLLAIAATVIGIVQLVRRRWVVGGVLLGVGIVVGSVSLVLVVIFYASNGLYP